ncbi:alpha/beta fold hydrolase [Winogradskyella sp.]|uniref:alpha/beta fold hydrolase n=1 Tax=Winogradskyella sp. TaxID=1883156 RepID=UPI003BA86875
MKKSLVRIASMLWPNGVTSFAYYQLTNPQVRKLRENELSTLNTADQSILKFKGFDIQLYIWIGGAKSILLIHGWEGQAGNFSDLIKVLIERDYTVYAFDGPSHGFSSKGKTSLFEFTELVGLLIKKYKVKNLVSHSFGGVATTYALYQNPEIAIDKYVLLTTPDKFIERIDDVCHMVGINDNIKKRLVERLENETGLSVLNLNVSDFVKSIHVNQALIIHDKDDKVIPIQRSRNVHKNWSASMFMQIDGTGHFRILRTPSVINDTIQFLKN